MEQVVLVNRQDEEIGLMEKFEAHRMGLLHRAFSILIFNSNGEMLLQKRAKSKYHSGGLWTNACCSHPLPGESMTAATRRKLMQEMGIDQSAEFVFTFQYRAELDNGLVENELDHVFAGLYDGVPKVNPNEVEEWKYVSIDSLMNDISTSPEKYTSWFKLILNHPDFQTASRRFVLI
ncbi:isopentenyl-diphosphate Delta-isomerase [soil metagenome]